MQSQNRHGDSGAQNSTQNYIQIALLIRISDPLLQFFSRLSFQAVRTPITGFRHSPSGALLIVVFQKT
jgi:hypothetical protein